MIPVYYEDYQSHCTECCLYNICSCEGKCACDSYREEHDPNCEGDYFFVDGEMLGITPSEQGQKNQ